MNRPVAWIVPYLNTFKDAAKVHFTRAPGNTMSDAELMKFFEGTVITTVQTSEEFPSNHAVIDRDGVTHNPIGLYHPDEYSFALSVLHAAHEQMTILKNRDDAVGICAGMLNEKLSRAIRTFPPTSKTVELTEKLEDFEQNQVREIQNAIRRAGLVLLRTSSGYVLEKSLNATAL